MTSSKTAPAAQTGPNTGQVARKRGSSRTVTSPKVGAKRAPAKPRKRAAAPKLTAGGQLRDELAKPGDPINRVMLIRQAARVADRLEVIDQLLKGDVDAWLKVSLPRSDAKRGRVMVEVQVGDLVKEERAQSVLFRSLLADIHRQDGGGGKGGGKGKDDDDDLVD